MGAIRWSGDGDRYWGPFTYHRDRGGYRPIAVMLGSGDGDEYAGCRFRLSAFGHTLIVALPAIIKPWRRWVDTSYAPWSSPRGGYWDTGAREYGFSCSQGHLSVAFGRVTHDSSTEQRWGFFLPWKSWRQVRRSFYGPAGEWVADEPHVALTNLSLQERRVLWDEKRAVEDRAPTLTFRFKDFDGEQIDAVTRIEEREWRLGEGRWRWLSLFRRARIDRSLVLRFGAEVGRRKGSWKGGTIGHSIVMLPGELHEAAFRRYCVENALTFVGAGD